jgi:hypothetical protein
MPYVQLEKLVQFFYSLDYDETIPVEVDVSSYQLHAQMFALADLYDIPELLSVAAHKYLARCHNVWKPLELLSSIPDVYDSTPLSVPLLRNIACTAIRKKLPTMLEEEIVAGRFNETVIASPEFAKELLQSYINNPVFVHCSTCNSHQRMDVLQVRCNHCRKGQNSFAY